MPPSRIFSLAIARRVVGSAEHGARRVAEPADRELEVRDRDPLVGRMDERCGDFGRQLTCRREEAVRDRVERGAQVVAVGEAGARERRSLRARLSLDRTVPIGIANATATSS